MVELDNFESSGDYDINAELDLMNRAITESTKKPMMKVYTKDGRYFKFTEYDRNRQSGTLKDNEGKIISKIYFYNDSISAIEYAW